MVLAINALPSAACAEDGEATKRDQYTHSN